MICRSAFRGLPLSCGDGKMLGNTALFGGHQLTRDNNATVSTWVELIRLMSMVDGKISTLPVVGNISAYSPSLMSTI